MYFKINPVSAHLNISNFVCMDVVTGGRDCPINSKKHTLQLNKHYTKYSAFL